MYFCTSAGSTPDGNMKPIMKVVSATLRKPSCSRTWKVRPHTLVAGTSRARPIHALVAAGLLVGLERARADLGNLARRVELALVVGGRPDAEFVVEALGTEMPVLVRDPFLQTAMRLNDELGHRRLLGRAVVVA